MLAQVKDNREPSTAILSTIVHYVKVNIKTAVTIFIYDIRDLNTS